MKVMHSFSCQKRPPCNSKKSNLEQMNKLIFIFFCSMYTLIILHFQKNIRHPDGKQHRCFSSEVLYEKTMLLAAMMPNSFAFCFYYTLSLYKHWTTWHHKCSSVSFKIRKMKTNIKDAATTHKSVLTFSIVWMFSESNYSIL